MPTQKSSKVRGFVSQVETQAAAKPKAKKISVDRDSALAAAALVKGKLDAASLGGKNGKGKTGRPIEKPNDPVAAATRERVRRHREKKSK